MIIWFPNKMIEVTYFQIAVDRVLHNRLINVVVPLFASLWITQRRRSGKTYCQLQSFEAFGY
jgi:hypothetical protein